MDITIGTRVRVITDKWTGVRNAPGRGQIGTVALPGTPWVEPGEIPVRFEELGDTWFCTADEIEVVDTLSLTEQKELIRAALAAVESGARLDEPGAGRLSEVVWLTTVKSLRFALIDHEDPDTGCLAAEGTECLAVVTARRILAVAS